MRKQGQYEIYDSSDSDEDQFRNDQDEPKSKSKWADIYGQGADSVSKNISKKVGDLTYYREQGVEKVRGGRLRGRGGKGGSRGGRGGQRGGSSQGKQKYSIGSKKDSIINRVV